MADQSWAMTGELVLSCNCTVFCPCVLSLGGHPPTEGYCQTWAGLRVDHGHFGDVDLSGLNLGLVGALPAAELIALARWGEMLDIGKLVGLGDLLQAEGDLYAAQGQTAAAADCHLKALEIILEVAASGEHEHNLRAVGPRLEELQARLAGAAVPEDLRAWLDDSLAAWSALPELPA